MGLNVSVNIGNGTYYTTNLFNFAPPEVTSVEIHDDGNMGYDGTIAGMTAYIYGQNFVPV
jgi:hypothetical protein